MWEWLAEGPAQGARGVLLVSLANRIYNLGVWGTGLTSICSGFAFKKGGRNGVYYKKPSVCRDHLSTCADLKSVV